MFIACDVSFAIGISYVNWIEVHQKKKSEKMKMSKLILDTDAIFYHLIEKKCNVIIAYIM